MRAGRVGLRVASLAAACFVVAALAGAAGGTGNPAPATSWIADGGIDAIVDTGTTTYLGGTFTEIGPRTGAAVAIGASTGTISPGAQVSGGNATVWAIAADSAGGFYVGGDFTSVGGVARHDLAHIRPDGTVDPSFDPEPDGVVYALALSGSTLYAGGDFMDIGNKAVGRIAALSASTGVADTHWNPFANATVRALAVSGDGHTVYVGGDFSSIGGCGCRYAGAVNGAGVGNLFGSATGWNPAPGAAVWSLAVTTSTVYLGGDFGSHILGVDPSTATITWTPSPTPDGRAYALAVAGGEVYAGGLFLRVGGGGQLQNGLARFDATTGAWDSSWRPKDFASPVAALAVSGSTVYVGGSFTTMFGSTRNNLAAFDATTGNLLAWDPSADGEVMALATHGSSVFAGGNFRSVNTVVRNRLAAMDDATGQVTSWNPGASGNVLSLAVSGSTVYVGGTFSQIGGQFLTNLARVGANGAVDGTWAPNPDGEVNAIALADQDVYAGGSFTHIGGRATSYIGEVNLVDGQSTSFTSGVNDVVYALALTDTSLYVGGAFTQDGVHARHELLALTPGTGSLQSWAPEADNTVGALAVSGSTVYAAGSFTSVGGSTRHFLAAIGMDGTVAPFDPEPDGVVHAIAAHGSTVYVGGQFATIGGQPRTNAAALDLSGSPKAFDPEPDFVVQAFGGANATLDVGGAFTGFGGGFESFAVRPTLTVTTTGTGSGAVASSPVGISCGATCSASFDPGTVVTLTATPAAGSSFAGWSGGGCSGTGTCQLTLNSDTAVTAAFSLPLPTITGFTPTHVAPGATVTVAGTHLDNPSAVTVNGTSASFAPGSSTQLTFTVPANATSGHVAVTTPGGVATSTGTLVVTVPPPVLQGFSPTQGTPGTTVTLSGSHFTVTSAVTFNGTPVAAVVFVNANTLTVHVPAGATTGKIAVTTAGGTATSIQQFTVLPTVPATPTISSFTPGSGHHGFTVFIHGSGFTGATVVAFNGAAAIFTVVNDTTIKAVVPFAATTGPISVTTPGGTAASALTFTVI